MKLDRIKKIRGHRIFKNFSWPGNLEGFSRFNLIYGWNGSGKTTLSNILYSLQSRTPVSEGEVFYEIDGNVVPGEDLPRATLPSVRVFNRDTIRRNVFESPGTAQLPPVFVFGEESVELQRRVEDLKAKLPALQEAATQASKAASDADKEATAFAASKAREIKYLLVASGGAYNNYNAGDLRQSVLALSLPLPTPLPDVEREQLIALKNSTQREAIELPSVPFPDLHGLYIEVREVLQETVDSSIASDLVGAPEVAAWVQQGLAFHTHEGDAKTCRFCAQPLPSERLRALESHFNNRFKEFAHRLDELHSKVVRAGKALDGIAFPSQQLLYTDFQPTYARELNSLTSSLNTVQSRLSALAGALRAKKDRIFERLILEDLLVGGNGSPSEPASFSKAVLELIVAGGPGLAEFVGKAAFLRLQQVVKQHNDRTSAFQSEVVAARIKLHDNEVLCAAQEWLDLESANNDASRLKTESANAVSELQQEILKLEADILQHRPAADELNRALVAYLGHGEIQVVPQRTGYQLVRRGVPAENLSEGERTAIAFLHFLGSLNDRSFDLATGIVVVDDPISSLDSNSTYTAFGFLKERLKEVNQLFVLTHNFTFFRQVRNWFQHINKDNKQKGRAGFYMLRAENDVGGRYACIESLDQFLRKYESEYHYLFRRVHDASTLSLGQPLESYYELPNLARRLLETFLVFKVPDKSSLHARLQEVSFPEPRKTRLLRFVDTHSHAEQIGDGHDEAASLAEAPAVLKDLLDLIQQADGEHYQRMLASLRT